MTGPDTRPFARQRRGLLLAAAAVVDDMTTKEYQVGASKQLWNDASTSKRLRELAGSNYAPDGPVGGTGVRLRLNNDAQVALLRYLQHIESLDIHAVKVSFGDDGGVTWRERADAMLREFTHVPFAGAEVLSVGVNTGGDIAALLGAGAKHVFGIDMVPELVAFTSALLVLSDADPARWRLLCGDAQWSQIYGAKFDVVYNVGVLYHVENPVSLLRRAFDALRPGGYLALETEIVEEVAGHGNGSAKGRTDDIMFWPLYEPKYVTRGKNWPTWFVMSERAVALMLASVGFTGVTRLPATVAKAAFVARRPE